MKKAIIVVLFLLITVCMSQAGEKEELVWQVKYYQEKMARMQSEYAVINAALKEATAKLKALNDADKAKKPKEKKSDGR